ncbi:Glutathione hydrolase 5 proenzyme [Merluccius polli]|uniref:Glutathione hydrolase n=1 Tax=Merluccius polli TaxID=89951 RepID=A0AA47MKK6_MERPO|nr:Glutathione hydrolase 5 proenzyme [Merluccius polli]
MAELKTWQVCVLVCMSLCCAVVLIIIISYLVVEPRCSSGSFTHAAVSADSRQCSDIGRDMLRRGGSAVDGAIAALLCTSVINPQSMGLGGGAIFTIRTNNSQVKVYSSRETVPNSFKLNLLKDCPNHLTLIKGSQWIGVPGELRGYQHVHNLYGRLPWAQLFQPTIELARRGTPLPAYLADVLSNHLIGSLVRGSSLWWVQWRVFCNQNGTVLGKGDILKFPKLADTMEIIAKQGAEALYSGQIGRDLVQDIREAGGTLTMDDLSSFRVRVADAWSISLGKTRMHLPPPPSGGAILGFILNIMKGFNLTSTNEDQRVQTYHRYVEAAKFANGQKHVIRDPVVNCVKNASYLLDGAFGDRVRKLIHDDRTHNDAYYNTTPSDDRFGTTHVSVLAEDGMAVSVTSTINQIFGSTIFSPRTGIILNNELADFCGRADSVKQGEQPPSSMAPVILESSSGETLVIGGSGGSMIITAVASALINHLWLGMNLQDAIAAPVVFVDSANKLNFEQKFNEPVKAGLKSLGHRVGHHEYFFNMVNAVAEQHGCITAISDSRKLGQASGY